MQRSFQARQAPFSAIFAAFEPPERWFDRLWADSASCCEPPAHRDANFDCGDRQKNRGFNALQDHKSALPWGGAGAALPAAARKLRYAEVLVIAKTSA